MNADKIPRVCLPAFTGQGTLAGGFFIAESQSSRRLRGERMWGFDAEMREIETGLGKRLYGLAVVDVLGRV